MNLCNIIIYIILCTKLNDTILLLYMLNLPSLPKRLHNFENNNPILLKTLNHSVLIFI